MVTTNLTRASTALCCLSALVYARTATRMSLLALALSTLSCGLNVVLDRHVPSRSTYVQLAAYERVASMMPVMPIPMPVPTITAAPNMRQA